MTNVVLSRFMRRFASRHVPLLLCLVVGTAVALRAQGQTGVPVLQEGDQHWEMRAQPGRIDAAIAAYQKAVTAHPNDVMARARLLRAWRFKGAYVAKTREQKQEVYAKAKLVGDDAVALVNRLLGAKAKGSEKQVAEAVRSIPGGADVFLWDSVNWGEWALAYGKFAAARQGAADRIRREATIAHLVDPHLEGAAPSRVLGRLHGQTPSIPFITGWASRDEGIRFLNESLKLSPGNKLTLVFLAEAIVDKDEKTKPRAIQLLRGVVAAPNDPQYVVEDTDATDRAKALLRAWGG